MDYNWWQELGVTLGVIIIACIAVWPWFTIPSISREISLSIGRLVREMRDVKEELKGIKTEIGHLVEAYRKDEET